MKPFLILLSALLMQSLTASAGSIHETAVKDIDGQQTSLNAYKGKVLLIVNVASRCGFTPQYKELESVYQKYKDKGFIVLGFPCNQFGGQEPEANETMEQTCKVNFGVTFPLFEKIDVNGAGMHPVFKFLKSKLGGWFGRRIKWNFTKFLVSADGK